MEGIGPLVKIAIAAIFMAAIVIFVYGWLAEMGNTSGVAKPIMTNQPTDSIFKPPKKHGW
jgi:hypothetical protein